MFYQNNSQDTHSPLRKNIWNYMKAKMYVCYLLNYKRVLRNLIPSRPNCLLGESFFPYFKRNLKCLVIVADADNQCTS